MRSVLSRTDGVAASTEILRADLTLPHPCCPWLLLPPATPPLPNVGSGSRPPRLQHRTETTGNDLSLGAAAARPNAAFTTRPPVLLQLPHHGKGLLCPGAQGHPARLLQAGGESCGLWSRSSALPEPVCTAVWRCRPLRRGLPGHGGVCSRRSTWSAGGGRRQLWGAGQASQQAGQSAGGTRGARPRQQREEQAPSH